MPPQASLALDWRVLPVAFLIDGFCDKLERPKAKKGAGVKPFDGDRLDDRALPTVLYSVNELRSYGPPGHGRHGCPVFSGRLARACPEKSARMTNFKRNTPKVHVEWSLFAIYKIANYRMNSPAMVMAPRRGATHLPTSSQDPWRTRPALSPKTLQAVRQRPQREHPFSGSCFCQGFTQFIHTLQPQ